MAFCLLVNSIAPLSKMFDASNIFTLVIETKQALFQLSSACATPVNEVSRVVGTENPLAAGVTAGSNAEDRSCSTDLIFGSGQRTSMGIKEISEGPGGLSRVALTDACLYPANFSVMLHHWPPGQGFVYVLFLVYLVTLSRSNLPWAAVPVCRRRR
jgi:hypothetical protein